MRKALPSHMAALASSPLQACLSEPRELDLVYKSIAISRSTFILLLFLFPDSRSILHRRPVHLHPEMDPASSGKAPRLTPCRFRVSPSTSSINPSPFLPRIPLPIFLSPLNPSPRLISVIAYIPCCSLHCPLCNFPPAGKAFSPPPLKLPSDSPVRSLAHVLSCAKS